MSSNVVACGLLRLATKLVEGGIRESLIQAGEQTCGYLNCKLFVQAVTGVSKLESLPSKPFRSISSLVVGDVLKWWGGNHYAIYLGDGEIMEVEMWGAPMRIVRLEEVTEEMDQPELVFSTSKQE